jgi:hypothetical protein
MRNYRPIIFLASFIIASCGQVAYEPEQVFIDYCPIDEDIEVSYSISNPKSYYEPIPHDGEGYGSCAHELNELCREVEALADAGLFNEQHFQWLCKGIGRDYFICP